MFLPCPWQGPLLVLGSTAEIQENRILWVCEHHTCSVIVMTFWYVFGTDLPFF